MRNYWLACWLFVFSGGASAYMLPPISLVTGNQYAPFADRNLPGGGMITEIIVAAYSSVGREVRPVFLPWRRGFKGVEIGAFAGTYPHFHTAELSDSFYYSNSIYPIRQRIYVRKGNPIGIDSLEKVSGLRLCSPIGHVLDQRLEKLVFTATISIISPSSNEVCAKMLERGRVDFMVLDENVYEYTLKGFKLQAVGEVLENLGLFLLFPKNQPDSLALLWEFNNGLQHIQDCGMFERIVKRHLQGEVDEWWFCMPGQLCGL